MKKMNKSLKTLILIIIYFLAGLSVSSSSKANVSNTSVSDNSLEDVTSYGSYSFEELITLVHGIYVIIDESDLGKRISLPKTSSESELKSVVASTLESLGYRIIKTKDKRNLYIKRPVIEQIITERYHSSYVLPQSLPISDEGFSYFVSGDTAILSGPKSVVRRALSLIKLGDVPLSARDIKYSINLFTINNSKSTGLDKFNFSLKGLSASSQFISYISGGESIYRGLIDFDSVIDHRQEFSGVVRVDTANVAKVLSVDNKFVSQSAVSGGVVSTFDSVRSSGLDLTFEAPSGDKSLSVFLVSLKVSRPMNDSSYSASEQFFTVPVGRDYCQEFHLDTRNSRLVGEKVSKSQTVICLRLD